MASSYRRDRDENGGDILLYVRQDMPSKLVSFNNHHVIQKSFTEINLRKKNWFYILLLEPKFKLKKYLSFL